MGFLKKLNESLKKESKLYLSMREYKHKVRFRVLDCSGKGVKEAIISVDGERLGVTDNRGGVSVEKKNLPTNLTVKAVTGVYSAQKEFELKRGK